MKLTTLIIVLFSLLLLAGCSENTEKTNEDIQSNVTIDENTQIDADVAGANIKVNGTSATINYEDKTVNAENVSITTNEDGVYEVNLSVKNNITLAPETPIEQWCIEGYTYDMKNENGQATTATILGIENYKDKIYCKATSTTKIYDMEVQTTYYFNYGAKDVWALVNIGGTINEMHINNN